MQLESELAALAMPESAVPASSVALIALIESRYHAIHRRELPELIRLARRVESVHAGTLEVPRGLADLLAAMERELEEHMCKEEQVLFPMMIRGGHPGIGRPIAVLRHEHELHSADLHALAALIHDGVPPADACNTWRALYAGIQKLIDDLMEHVHIENNVLFPRFGA